MKVAVLGIGGMGSGVVRQMLRDERVEEVVGMDVREERVRDLREDPGIDATTDLDQILNDEDVELVFVTASNHAHKELTIRSIEAGKAVMCEKPMATTLGDAEEMVEVAECHDAFLQIGFELRYSKLYTKIKEWIDEGLLGDVVNTHCYYISSEFHGKGSWRNKKATGGSMFGEKLSHYVDLPRWWVGTDVPVAEVYSACSPNVIPYYEVHDNYHTTYRFENGAVGHLTFMMALGATFRGDPLQNVVSQQKGDGHALRYTILGTKGAAMTDVFDRSIKRWEFGDSPECMTSEWVEDLSWDESKDGQYFHWVGGQNHDVVRRVAAGEPPKIPARDALETMRLCFAAEESADREEVVQLAEMG